jgi:hypothetical protein
MHVGINGYRLARQCVTTSYMIKYMLIYVGLQFKHRMHILESEK